MKYFFTCILFFSFSLFTMEPFLKRITLPSVENLIAQLDPKHHSLAHKLGGKTLYPSEIVMIVQSFYNYEGDVVKKSKHFTQDIPAIVEKVLSDYPATIDTLKKHFFKI